MIRSVGELCGQVWAKIVTIRRFASGIVRNLSVQEPSAVEIDKQPKLDW